ncbi:ATPase [candidate division WWE3 bacterium CG08_land_8_20_14_0_20_41_10]|uniref:ATPase n=1 Tax=candidate division WWE3 bacterium CG08_land_8_20_14_0_20_41_10 TaxID=1975085 RepID=A0A2H0XCF1_UNCKA|nr:MAG: ATPase [candidate division WWE3 bacterium CG08_land_8_20_14_0_20_41_10]
MIERFYTNNLESLVIPNKVLIVYGPRQVGKTTLVESFLNTLDSSTNISVYRSTGENITTKEVLESSDFSKIIPFFESYKIIFIDEAQKISNIGQGLKILVDQIPGIKIIATGSSSFELSNKVGEPLVGRAKILILYPLSVLELIKNYGNGWVIENLENLLVYGGYPEVLNSSSNNQKVEYLNLIRDSYLYKDILELEKIKNSKKIFDLLRLLAFQVGNEVSIQELSKQLSMTRNLVEKYLDLLEKSFVIINLRGFSKNLRSEITKTSKYYFYDNGIRNAVIGNFNYLANRNDVGALWENFLFIERLKKQAYTGIHANNYFWRTWEQKELDFIEERDGKLFSFEFKYSKESVPKPKLFLETYPEATFELINRDNFINFLT